ncbi:tRNA pseudouridine(13) synthase TruD [Candidatus Woesearchaeota archaeon]|nr:tRNA pseudouridine(13) synthase TruD [Candidatus Woesearchaeota archaeon]
MKTKQIPEDFIVEEKIELKLKKEKLDYSIWKLTKKGWESFKIIQAIAKSLRTNPKFVGFAGNKDRNAVTTQYISIYKIPKSKIEKININEVKLEFVGYSKNRINLGDLIGNNFKIVVRELNNKTNLPKNLHLENYFDEQRFGNKQNTHFVGKSLLKRNFKEVCELLNLKVENNNYVGEIKKQQRRLLRFYISSYQSYLWNKTLNEILKEKKHNKFKSSIGEFLFTTSKIKNFKIPIANFDTDKNDVLDKIMNEEGIKRGDFIVREIPELITQGVNRDAFVNVENIKYKWAKEELNKDKLKLELSFFLPKGSYATMLVKKLSTYLQ